ncbi:MAG: serine hydrolase [Pirellulaceae bacterium]|jgi:D-alanyl-D-alanine carboxypeptidase (penicillin-binding protein 5/6)
MVNESRKIDESWLRLVGSQYLRRSFGIGVVLGILVALAIPTFAQDAWKGQIEQWVKEHRGEVAIYVNWADSSTDADPPPLLEIACDRPMPTASLIKVAVLAELYRQIDRNEVSSDELLELRKEDAVPGSGILTEHFAPGTRLPLATVARLMIAWSDNTATNLLLDRLGIAAVNRTMDSLGFDQTHVHSKVFRRDTSVEPEASQRYGLGRTTARQMGQLLSKIHRKELFSADASEVMLAHLAACDDTTKILRELPKSLKAPHKTGAVTEVRTDAALLPLGERTLVVVILTAGNEDGSWGDRNAAEILMGKIGKILFDQFATKQTNAVDADQTPLQVGSNGRRVLALQRTLNQNRPEKDRLTEDGEFGPATLAAVQDFQRQHQLEETGIVEAKTWASLGAIRWEADPIPSQEQRSRVERERRQSDLQASGPHVSAKAWVIYDPQSDQVLAGHQQDLPLPMASTTKIMTAWLVHQEISRRADLVARPVAFSREADATEGSSALVEAGESVSLEDAFHGLMLPSGNDMAIALAEWWASIDRDATDETAPKGREKNPAGSAELVAAFVEAMNREAARLELNGTRFTNPHGLPAADHQSSAIDMARLAAQFMKVPSLRELVAKRQHVARIDRPDGSYREILWKNTNPLLDTQGYEGIKTGTTEAAGACLVSSSLQGDSRLIVVQLGSKNSDTRELDARNLHRWGWQLVQPKQGK